ncbi:MAG: NAD(P)H-dependent oxidoreductase [Flavobacteriaceae bacterium]
MDIIERLKWRYATKKFNPNKKLAPQKLEVLKQAFNLTATSFGLQTVKLIVVENKAVRELLVKSAFNQKQVADASHLLIICIQDNVLDEDVVNYYEAIKDIRKTPETILKPYRESLIKTLRNMSVKERQNWSTNQAYIALGNLMTVCAVEAIDACPMEGFLLEEFDKILNLKALALKSVLLLPVGYRAEDDMFSGFEKVRMPVSETVIEL